MHAVDKDPGSPSVCIYLNITSKTRGQTNDSIFPHVGKRDTSILFIDHNNKPYRGWNK